MAGCRSSVKQNLTDFRAYYNTYYNAKENFNLGLKKVNAQQREYNPLIPIRVHLSPVNAGRTDFEAAIDKGADILRKFENSKWVDNAIELIGKSYFYRQEYFSAEQKFSELYQATESEELKQRAVYWRGRTLLEMQLNEQAVEYLQSEITVFEDNWNKGWLAETRAVLAEHFVDLENYEAAEAELSLALKNLTEKEHKARGYFLYGQLLELNGKLEEAYSAYDRVGKYYQDYNLLFEANVKKGQVARDLGRNEESQDLFESLGRDDKNFTVKADLDYELGKALQASSEFEAAEQVYNSVLRNNISKPSVTTVALTYYGLAEINRFYHNDFQLAAAYYDSSSKERAPVEELPEEFDAPELARSFGEYSRLINSIELHDSLLWLGQLDEATLDSVVLELKKQRKAELEAELKEAEDRKNTLVTVNQSQSGQQNQTNTQNGFLNFKNPVLLADARSQFQAIWGDRPLVDNWRRFDAIVVELNDSTQVQQQGENIFAGNASIRLSDIQIDLSGVPFAEEDRDSVKNLMAEEYYELGNLFFLSLDLPDSAQYYFEKVINEYPESDDVAIAYYSLSDLLFNLGEMEEAREQAENLIRAYPESEYAKRLADRFNIPLEVSEVSSNKVDSLRLAFDFLNAMGNSPQKADTLRKFARNHQEYPLAPRAMLDAAMTYSEVAKDSSYFNAVSEYQDARNWYNAEKEEFEVFKDSIRVELEDSTLTVAQQAALGAKLDSTFKNPDYDELFPYLGVYWDSTRSVLKEFTRLFRTSQLSDMANRLQSELSVPAMFIPKEEPVDTLATDTLNLVSDSTLTDSAGTDSTGIAQEAAPKPKRYIPCRDIRIQPEVAGGMDRFSAVLLAQLKGKELEFPAVLRYKMFISEKGALDRFELLTTGMPEATITYLEDFLGRNLRFEPPVFGDGESINLQCDVLIDLTGK